MNPEYSNTNRAPFSFLFLQTRRVKNGEEFAKSLDRLFSPRASALVNVALARTNTIQAEKENSLLLFGLRVFCRLVKL